MEHDFGECKTVLMFATGIGIAGQILYMKELIRGYNNCEVRTRCIVPVWQMDYEYKNSRLICIYMLSPFRSTRIGKTLDGQNDNRGHGNGMQYQKDI